MEANFFFRKAFREGAGMAGSRSRILQLLGRLGNYMSTINWNRNKRPGIKEMINTLGRLLKAFAAGQYNAISLQTVILILAAVIYFINPFDLIPDMIPITGLTDDFGVLLMVYTSVRSEIEKFEAWEKSQRGKLDPSIEL